ncbi:alcohol dehydrogenase catalytic domain-containing protein [Nonomuraea sp. NPDC004702]
MRYPFRPGYSMAGIVEAVGEGVTTVRPGDRVQSYASHQELVTLPEREARLLPGGVADEEAVWVPLVVTAAGTARAAITLGETVVVIGLGPVGQLVVQYAVAHGASRVIAVDTDARRLGLARTLGRVVLLGDTPTPPSSPTTRQPARSTVTRWPSCTSAASPPARSVPPE